MNGGTDRRKGMGRRAQDKEARQMIEELSARVAGMDSRVAGMDQRMSGVETWSAKHDQDCAERFRAIQIATAPIPKMAEWHAQREAAEASRARFWAKLADFAVSILRKGFEDAMGKIVWITVVLAIAGTSTGFFDYVKAVLR